jgi:hypothetical protein
MAICLLQRAGRVRSRTDGHTKARVSLTGDIGRQVYRSSGFSFANCRLFQQFQRAKSMAQRATFVA